ncbi:peptidoglycan-binding protein [Aureimonas sp. SA4125]|uniref:peptidoglycan-binding domain-containing protein n=1 Tax=Aureimonas sp. SA4125 TaxID=2826993 RepID=UPI001CC582AC|nr:peptidoglycan-binding protein [Aureimonas sp. SA4125]BDA83673.1 peptidoglycan-binding protein [Aureimonas sp. SA4125]
MPAKRQTPLRAKTGRAVARPSVARRGLRLSVAALSLIGRPIAARPVLSGGIAGVAILFALVSGNAILSQPGRHPRPMMATRGPLLDQPATELAAAEIVLQPVPLVLEVQEELARTGHYALNPDGRPGKATAAAIRAFQSEHALRVDGEPSPLLLSQIRQLAGEAPSPSARPDGAERMASIEPAEASRAAADPATTGSTGEEISDKELVRRIQSGLANADVAKLTADGVVGEQTRAAIRTFEALEGMDVTGRPNKRLLDHLIAIGAVK